MTEAELCRLVHKVTKQLAHRYKRWAPQHITEEDLYQEGMMYVLREHRRNPGQTKSYYSTAARYGMANALAPFKRVGRTGKTVQFEPQYDRPVQCNDEYVVTRSVAKAVSNLAPKMKQCFLDWYIYDLKRKDLTRQVSDSTLCSSRKTALLKLRKELNINGI